MKSQLPTVKLPEYNVKLIDGKQIKIRPIVAKEEKILLMAIESEPDNMKLYEIILNIVESCILTKGIKVSNLTPIDIEMILLEIRKNSVGEIVETNFDLRKTFECAENECPETIKKSINLNNIETMNKDNISKTIKLDENVSVKLKHKLIKPENASSSKVETIYGAITTSIDIISDGDTIIKSEDFTFKELNNWVEMYFSKENVVEALEFVKNQPYLRTNISIKCSKCGKEKEMELKGIFNFFM